MQLKPSIALNVAAILRKIATFYISECIKKEDHITKKQITVANGYEKKSSIVE